MKSLLSFGHKTGYLTLNVGAAIFLPKIKSTLAERILSEDDVMTMLALERNPRNKTLLRLLYLGGLRISEICELRVRDMAARDDAGQITVFGKGGKTRAILLKASIWKELTKLRGTDPDAPVFRSRKGAGHLDPVQVHRIVKAAAARANLSDSVGALASPCPCQPRPRSRCARSPGAGNRRSCQPLDHEQVRPRATD